MISQKDFESVMEKVEAKTTSWESKKSLGWRGLRSLNPLLK